LGLRGATTEGKRTAGGVMASGPRVSGAGVGGGNRGQHYPPAVCPTRQWLGEKTFGFRRALIGFFFCAFGMFHYQATSFGGGGNRKTQPSEFWAVGEKTKKPGEGVRYRPAVAGGIGVFSGPGDSGGLFRRGKSREGGNLKKPRKFFSGRPLVPQVRERGGKKKAGRGNPGKLFPFAPGGGTGFSQGIFFQPPKQRGEKSGPGPYFFPAFFFPQFACPGPGGFPRSKRGEGKNKKDGLKGGAF